MSIMSMKAAVIVRCSGSLFFSSTCARVATGMADAMSSSPTSPTPGARRRSTSGGAASRIAASFRGPTQPGSSRRAQRLRDADLAGVRDGFHLERLGHRRAADQQLAVDAAGQPEVERPGAGADGHPERQRPAREVQPADAVDRSLHLPGGAAGAALVLGSVEQEEQRVAAPLEEARAPVVRLVEQRAEHAVEGVAHQLGADLALAGEPLAERGEAGDVDEDEGAVELHVELIRVAPKPVDDQPRDVRGQHVRRRRRRRLRRLGRLDWTGRHGHRASGDPTRAPLVLRPYRVAVSSGNRVDPMRCVGATGRRVVRTRNPTDRRGVDGTVRRWRAVHWTTNGAPTPS